MATTISVSEETRDRLMQLKREEGARSLEDLLARLVVEHRKLRLLDASATFRAKLAATGAKLEDLIE